MIEAASTEKDIFIDTSAFIAMRVTDDPHYNRAQEFLGIIKKQQLHLHATNFILDEIYTYFCRFHEIAVEMGELIMYNPLITLHRVAVEDEERAWSILQTYSDKDFSYTDATSFAVMEKLGIEAAFVFDEHFRQYGKYELLP